ncbi:MAG: hypothetical protein A2015_09665 [Spirochaetes bacterium GWF1_31_7]|nr:MAG: hypothetical protein A2Y30_04510 [Spirochaetes bacterium GWE1_32_154]OHD47553.1 MAG: hypothetical protein A2015_09665 [Spirochaetes bacterium GWF1_31_7]OHD52043.1 MAG: hypothetical protein A2Y29_17425 [Spirochaetes bacterium GWE2_31_10]HBD93462.1 hypothetical protein [Spirochaetia bacterium]HBI36230.1 hypothetical protein [Spirochaetia bacterium]
MENEIDNYKMKLDSLRNKIPFTVNLATILIISSFYLGVLNFLLIKYTKFNDSNVINIISIIGMTLLMTICCLIPFFMRKGKNWARLIYLILVAPGLIFYIFSIILNFRLNVILGSVSTMQYILQLIGFILLLMKDTNDWFKDIKALKNFTIKNTETSHNKPISAVNGVPFLG